LKGHLVLEDAFPIAWVQAGVSAAFSEARVLSALMALDNDEKEREDSPLGRELSRLDAKINLVLLLLGDLRREKPMPPKKPAILSARELAWQEPDPPSAGERIGIEMFLNIRYPCPLRLQLQVDTMGSDGWAKGVWVNMDPLLQEQLQQYIFRAHRRKLARQKYQGHA
jgi:hypothetical protein